MLVSNKAPREMSVRTHNLMIIRPKPYHSPPCPTSADRRTLVASALSAFRTLAEKGGGIVKSA